MSNLRQTEGDLIARVWPARHVPGTRIGFRYDDWGQLAYAAEGAITVATPDGSWVVPPYRAVWVPPGVPHEIIVHGKTTLRSLYLRSNRALGNQSRAIALTPLARGLVLHIAAAAPLSRTIASDRRLVAVLLDHLRELPILPVYLPEPASERVRRAAEMLRRWNLSADEVARSVGQSRRTLERLFRAETGLSLGAWRHQARLLEAMRLLAQGESVGETAFRLGYASDSAFIYAFRRAFDCSPGSMYA